MKANSSQYNSGSTERFIRFSFLLPLVFMFLFGGVRRAAAQGTMGMLPSPMTTTELNGYAERLGLSPQQGVAVEEVHDRYKGAYRALREGEIKKFMEEMQSMSGGMPQRKQFESFLNNLTRLNKKIFALDRGLFDEMIPLLDETQMGMLPRVRQARQRHCYGKSPMMFMSGGRPLDLTEMWWALDLSREERAAADPLMSQYESTLTKKMGELYRAMPDSFRNMFDAMEELGIDEETMSDPEQAAEMMQQMMEIQREIMKKSMEMGQEIRALNKRTVRGVRAMLPVETGRSFYLRYLGKAYPATRRLTGAREGLKRAVRRIEGITAAQGEAIGGLVDQHREEEDRILKLMVKHLDARGPRDPFGMNVDEVVVDLQKHTEALEELQGRANEMATQMRDEVIELLGKEQATLLLQVAARLANGDEAAVKKLLKPKTEGEKKKKRGLTSTRSGELPRQIYRPDLVRYLEWLEVEEEMKVVALMLLEDYRKQYETIRQGHGKRRSEAFQSKGGGERVAARKAALERRQRVDQQARTAVKRQDDELFDQLAALLDVDESEELGRVMERVRRHRARQRFGVPSAIMSSIAFPDDRATKPGTDLGELVGQLHLEPEKEKILRRGMDGYDKALTDLLEERNDLAQAAQLVADIWSMEDRIRQEKEGDSFSRSLSTQEYMKNVGPAQRKVKKIDNALLELSRSALEEIMGDLSAEQGGTLRQAFNREVFPVVYNDPQSLESVLSRARKLDDLSERQRERLDGFTLDYLPAYGTACDEMAAHSVNNPGWPMAGGQEGMMEWQRYMGVMTKLKFERSELNARGGNRLKSILSEEQIERIGGLPEPPKDRRYPW